MVLQPWVLTTRDSDNQRSYKQECYNHYFLQLVVLQAGVLTTRDLTTSGLTTRGSYNQGSFNQGSYKQRSSQAGVLQLGVLTTRCLTTRSLRTWGSYNQGFLQLGVLTTRPGLLEAWLVLTSVKYHGNLYILIPLNQRLALTRLRATGPRCLTTSGFITWGCYNQGPVVRRPISANPGLNFNPGFFFFCSN